LDPRKFLEDEMEVHFDVKTLFLHQEFLFFQHHVQVEKDDEFFKQYIFIMYFLGRYSELISFRVPFFE